MTCCKQARAIHGKTPSIEYFAFLQGRSSGIYSLLISAAIVIMPLPDAYAGAEQHTSDTHFLGGMVPKGHWAAVLDNLYRTSTERFNDNGDRESLTADSDGLVLDAQVVPLLTSFGAGASLGTVSLKAKLVERRHDLTVGYGLSENLTLGFSIPYGSNETKVDFKMLGGNLASNPYFDSSQPISATNPPLVPVGALGTTVPAGTEGVQQLLSNSAFGYQYDKIGSARTSGMGDPLIGFRWQFFNDPVSRAILTPVVRLGMSNENNPDNLFDVAIDDGSTDLRLQVEYIYAPSPKFDTRLRLCYTWQLPDSVTTRAYAEGEYLVPKSRTEKLDRNLGNIAESYLELGYLAGDWRLYSGFDMMRKGSDDYASPSGQDVSGLEANTEQVENLLSVGLSWSGVNQWRQKKLPFPILLQAGYRKHLFGRNRLDRTDYLLGLTAVF